MHNLIPHVFNTITIRSLERDGQIWFVAADVCKALEINNPSQALTRLDSDEKTTLTNNEGRAGQGAQNYNIINESGLYSLILRSRKTEAKQFKKWVTSEVLPSIRKTGSYSLTLNKQQQYLIKEAVLNTAAKTGKTYQSVYRKLYTKFKVPRYQDILAKDFDAAIQLLTVTSKENQSYIIEIPFDLRRNSRYLVQILNGKAQRVSIAYAEMQEDYGKPWSPK